MIEMESFELCMRRDHLSESVVHGIDGPANHPSEEAAGIAHLVRQTVHLEI